MSPRDGLHRRTISKALQEKRGWEARSRVDGDVLVRPSGSVALPVGFSAEVREAVAALGYSPEVSSYTDRDGVRWIRVKTPETSTQSGRGAHD
jgi:hypothetical protein